MNRQKFGRKPRLTVAEILQWADDYYRENGQWPHHFSGRIKSAVDETWGGVNDALYRGSRGLRGGSTLARELYRNRGVRSPRNVPPLSEAGVFAWARAHFARTGNWPQLDDGPIVEASGETWAAVDLALARGTRGLPGGSSIAQLLEDRGVKRSLQNRSRLRVNKILKWADAYFRAHGHWPYRDSGPIDGSDGETWTSIHKALQKGARGLRGRSSLSDFLNRHRDIREGKTRRSRRIDESKLLNLDQIVAWGEAWRKRTGHLPKRDSGAIPGTQGLKWSTIDSALKRGSRGLVGGSSLVQLLRARLAG